jgi:hypothetical protein
MGCARENAPGEPRGPRCREGRGGGRTAAIGRGASPPRTGAARRAGAVQAAPPGGRDVGGRGGQGRTQERRKWMEREREGGRGGELTLESKNWR